ncbi:MAG: type II toxin-antitoxin system Phd/YefM family antitoxin [Verrucomicrobiota bacterium]
MKAVAVGEFKSHFSEVLDEVKHGEEFVVCYGRKKEKVAVLIPYEKYMKKPVVLGVMEGIASYRIKGDFKMTDEEFLDS